jgi:predicted CXXCH cytochrome family protein
LRRFTARKQSDFSNLREITRFAPMLRLPGQSFAIPVAEGLVKRGLGSIIVFVLMSAATVFAGKHPVTLDAKTDPAKCIECHEEKTKGKAVHSAIAMGCTTCHEIRSTKDVTRIKLTTTTPAALCITCHSDKKAADIHGQVHQPAIRDCVKCHDPHSADNKNQLLKPVSGTTKDENLCLSCHKIGVDVPKDGSRHAALDMGCDSCHVTHKTGERGKREFDFHLLKDAPALCMNCHDVKEAAIVKAHQGQPFAKADCLTCHDPHQSAQPKLLAKFTHVPFAGKQCDSCHQPSKDGKVVLTAASSKELCLTCHSDKGEQIEKAKVQHPGAAGDCIDCHNPHAGKSPGFPKPDAVNACLACHSDQAEQHKKTHLHQPAFEQGCATCHEPHGGDNAHLLRAKSVNSLCLECHGPERAPVKVETDHIVTIFNGKVRLPEDYFRFAALPLKYGHGHPVDRHPVIDAPSPSDHGKVMKVDCLTCHQPHSSSQPDLLVKDQQNNMAFCSSCHASTLGVDSDKPQTPPQNAPKAAGTK